MSERHEVDEVELRRQVGTLVDAIRAKDLDVIRRLYAADVVSFDVGPPLQHVGIEAKAKNWANVFTLFRDVTYEARDLTLTVGDDVAFGHFFGRLSGTLNAGTVTSGMWVRGTLCFRKDDGHWLIAHDQVSVPLDMQTGQAATNLEP